MDMVNDVLGPGLYNNVRLAIDRETGRQRGFGHIDFKGENYTTPVVLSILKPFTKSSSVDH